MKGMKTGGRTKGVPNKEKSPIVKYLKHHSEESFEPKEELFGTSQFDLDTEAMTPEDRANIEVRVAEFHTPKKKAVDVDMNADIRVRTIEDRLRILCGEDADDDDTDDD